MDQAIFHKAKTSPDAIAVVEGDIRLTFAGLVSESQKLASMLHAKGTSMEEPFGILLAPGINLVIAQFATILAQGTCVPVDPKTPKLRLKSMFRDVGVRHIIAEEGSEYELDDTDYIFLGNIRKKKCGLQHEDDPTTFTPRFISKTHRTHILFTSGSTGKPKPVQISARNIMHLATNTPITPLSPNYKVAHFNNPGFDLSLFEVWVTLISGATIVTIKKEIVPDPAALKPFLDFHKVTVMILSVALMETLVFGDPSIFCNLKHVLSAGDVASVKAMRAMCPRPENIWNTYGPTECTTLATALLVTEEELKRDRISIGRAVGDMKVYLLDENLKPIHRSGTRGEICISGPQQSAGYLNMPVETETNFIYVKNVALGLETRHTREDASRLYRTGDYAEWRPSSELLEFLGRSDRQVKHNGFRVELSEVERHFLLHEDVESVAVVHVSSVTDHKTSHLVAFIRAKAGGDLRVEDLSAFAREQLPLYMVPDSIELIDDLPLTSNGKLDRQALKERYLRKPSHDTVERRVENGKPTTKSTIQRLWKNILPRSRCEDEDDFVEQGASSLQNATLISLIQKHLDCPISMEKFLQNTRLRDLVSLVDQAPKCETAAYTSDETEVWIRDVDLADQIELVPNWTADEEGRVFLTGATGFVGANLLRHLIDMPAVKQVACLARRQGSLSGADHIQATLEQYDLWPTSLQLIQKIIVLEGDMTDENLGLGPERFTWLTNWTSVVFHLGAKVNFCETYAAHYDSNVLGTKHVLRVAALGRRKAFHYMSSIDVWGPTGFILGTRRVMEDGPLHPHIQCLRYDLGYSASQWTAEQMVRRMRDRGLPVAIYRPGYIIGDSKTGAMNPNDFFSRLIVGCIQIGSFPDLQQNLEFCTIDYVIPAMVHIATSNENLGRSYSLLSPDPAVSISVRETCGVIQEAGYPVKLVKYSKWVDEVVAGQLPDGPLAPLMPMFEEKVLGELTRWEASQNTPIYDSTNAANVLKERPDIRYKPLDPTLLKLMISFWNRKGLYQI
ncbi:linear gramicidin synthase subunit D [Aspergillus udagawae]|nr:linear gramicidin synthase subunit D [Aspergillus udagawae]GFG17362.1 linear gramicidin synthase subunit D [Aspergillus udagawae]